jgi:hypothetical protein
MSRGLAKILQIMNIIAMVVLMLLFRENKLAMYAVVAACCVIAVALNYFLRCPHCGAWPRKGSFFHEFCPRCGKRLDDRIMSEEIRNRGEKWNESKT